MSMYDYKGGKGNLSSEFSCIAGLNDFSFTKTSITLLTFKANGLNWQRSAKNCKKVIYSRG